MKVVDSSEWATAVARCRDHDWSGAAAALSANLGNGRTQRIALISRAACRLMAGDETRAIVDLCAAADLTADASDAEVWEGFAQALGNDSVAQVNLLIAQELPRSGITLEAPPMVPITESPSSAPEKPRRSARSLNTMEGQWGQVSSEIDRLVQARSWREAEKTAQAFLAQVEATVPGRSIGPVELSALQTQVEAALMAVHRTHSADLLRENNPALALIFARRASSLLGPHQDSSHVVAIRTAAARAAIALPVVEEALDELEEASRHVRTREERAEVGELLAQLGDVAREHRVWILATSAYRLAAAMYRQSEASDDSARALALMLETAAKKIAEEAASFPA